MRKNTVFAHFPCPDGEKKVRGRRSDNFEATGRAHSSFGSFLPILFGEHMTSSQINDTFLFHRVIKILTGGRILQISIARCQIEAEIHSFPTMYGKGGGRCGKNWRNQGFRPKVMPKTRLFGGHKSGSSHFRVAWGPLFQR